MTDRRVAELLLDRDCGQAGCVCQITTAEGFGMTHCPAHDDATPSLNVTQGTDKLLLKCFAGCRQEQVLNALRARNQWERRTTYDYRDADGVLLYQSVRTEIPGQKKDFYQRRPDARGGWINKTRGIKRVPYHLPELLAAPMDVLVFSVEGEKDVANLEKHGLVATTNVGGAGNWLREYNQYFAGRQVVVLADNDDAGRKHRRDVVRGVLTTAATVFAPDLPGLGDKEDISDLLERGYTADELLQLVANTPPVSTASDVSVGAVDSVDDADEGPLLGTIPEFPTEILPAEPKALVEESSLPTNLLAASTLAALMTAIGGEAEIAVSDTWLERPNEFLALVAPPTTGKSPSERTGFGPLMEIDHARRDAFERAMAEFRGLSQGEKNLTPRPIDTSFLRSKFTPESSIRRLNQQPSTAFVLDELSISLGQNQYRPEARGVDLGYLLEMWDGDVLRYERVGGSETAANAVDIVVQRPTAVLIGGLQPQLHALLGSDEDGLRARWLLHMAMPTKVVLRMPSAETLAAYAQLLKRLVDRRNVRRRWVLPPEVYTHFLTLQDGWKERARAADLPPSMGGFLGKADRHVLRVALTLAECGLEDLSDVDDRMQLSTPLDALERAARWIEFCASCWSALPSGSPFSLTPRDRQLDLLIDRVIPYLEQRGGLSARTLRRNGVGGIGSKDDLDAFVERYRQRFPGCVEVVHPSSGGPASTLISPPKRANVWGYPPPPPAADHQNGSVEPSDGHFENELVREEPETVPDERPESPDKRADLPVVRRVKGAVLPDERQRSSGIQSANGTVADANVEQSSFAPKPLKPTRASAKKSTFPEYPTPTYTVVSTAAALADTVATIANTTGFVGLDTETTDLHVVDGRVRLIQFAYGDQAAVIDVDRLGADINLLAPLFSADAGPTFALHNAPFDAMWLQALGMPAIAPARVFDTFVAAHLLLARGSPPKNAKVKPARYGLADLVERYFKLSLPKELQVSQWDANALTEEQIAYAARDAHATAALASHLLLGLEKHRLQAAMLFEMDTLPAMVELCSSGVLVDRQGWYAQADRLAADTDRLLFDRLVAPYGPKDLPQAQQAAFWRSPKKKLALLGQLGIPAEKTNEKHLLSLKSNHPLIPDLIAWQKLQHSSRTYGDNYLFEHLASDSRLYPGWVQLGTDVGRMSCHHPNLQNIPRSMDFRKCVIAPPGRVFAKADYAALHPRIIAHLAPEPLLIERFNSPHPDAYRYLAARIHRIDDESLVTRSQRQLGKTIFLGFCYGAHEERFIKEVRAREGIEYSLAEAARFRNAFMEAYPGIRAWHNRYDGETPETVTDRHTGRKRFYVISQLEKINSPVLMVESAGFKAALQGLMQTIDSVPGSHIVMTIHDEIVVETDIAMADHVAAWLEREMLAAMQPLIPDVPVVVETSICLDYAGTPLEREVVPIA